MFPIPFQVMNLVWFSLIMLEFSVAVPSSLRLVHLIFQHGERTAIYTYPKDPYGLSVWKEGPGQLTQVGIEQVFRLGQSYREWFDGFMDDTYNVYELAVHSSDADRCLMSAQSFLCGFYGVWKGNGSMVCQPAPIHTRPELEDNYLAMFEACPRWLQAYAEELHSEEVTAEEMRNQDFFDMVKDETGLAYVNGSNIYEVADTFYVQKLHNFTLPVWVNDTVMEKFAELKALCLGYMFNSKNEKRLKGGTLLKKILQQMESKMNGSMDERAKMFLYSSHDFTIAAILDTLDLYNGKLPPYTSSVLIELHENSVNNSFYVKLFYKNDDSSDPMELTLPGCQADCPIEMFKELTKDFIPGIWENECKLPEKSSYKFPEGGPIAIAALSGFLFGALLTAICSRVNRGVKDKSYAVQLGKLR